MWWLASALAGTARIGLFVGSDVGLGHDPLLRFAETEAREFEVVFTELGGVEQTRVLRRPSTQELRRALDEVDARVQRARARGDDAMVVFFYSGHASSQGLHLGGQVFAMDALRDWLENSDADMRLAILDACSSGTLARTRGGTPVEPIEVTIDDSLSVSGLAVVASTGPRAVARESDAIGGGVFAQAMLQGLRGDADLDVDGVVTLQEAYQHAFEETLVNSASAPTPQRPEVRYDIEGIGHLPLTETGEGGTALWLDAESEGAFSVIALGTGRVVGRFDKQAGKPRRVSLAPGRYLVRKTRRQDVQLAEVNLLWGGEREIGEGDLRSVPPGQRVRGGGRPVWMGLSATMSPPATDAHPVSMGAQLQLAGSISPHWGLVGFGGLQGGVDGHADYRLVRGGLGVRYAVPFGRVSMSVQTGLSVSHHTLVGEEDAWREPALGGFAGGAVHVALGGRARLDAGVHAHLSRPLEEAEFTAALQPSLGLSYRIGRGPRGRTVSR